MLPEAKASEEQIRGFKVLGHRSTGSLISDKINELEMILIELDKKKFLL